MDTKNIKGCNYRLIGYPESMHPHVLDKLKEMGVPFAVSTLHDRDRFDSDTYDENNTLVHRAGDLKKAHYHFFIKFAGGTTWKTVHDRIAEPFGLVLDQNPSKCLAFSEAIALRYFLHLDDPDKFQYGLSELDSCFFYGYDSKKLEEIFSSNSYRVSYLLDLKRLIYAYDILFVNQLIDYLELTKYFLNRFYPFSVEILGSFSFTRFIFSINLYSTIFNKIPDGMPTSKRNKLNNIEGLSKFQIIN